MGILRFLSNYKKLERHPIFVLNPVYEISVCVCFLILNIMGNADCVKTMVNIYLLLVKVKVT